MEDFQWCVNQMDKLKTRLKMDKLDGKPIDPKVLEAMFSLCQLIVEKDFSKRKYAYKQTEWLKNVYGNMSKKNDRYLEAYWEIMFWEAPNVLDSYCRYIEKDRKPEERFYEPRRKTLIKVADMLQRLEDDELDECFIHQPARTGKTQIITMATAWHCARNTELSNLYCSYKEDAGGAFLDGVKEIWTDPIYLHNDVFPLAKIVSTDAKANTVDLERKKKYKSLSGKGLTSGLNGLYDATGWIIGDDLLEGIQDVLSPEVLARKKLIFNNNLMSRKKEKCKAIWNGTIWSLHDIYMTRLEFLQNNPEAKDIRFDVLKLPALNPDNDESNFDYDYGVGFSTKYYRAKRAEFEEADDIASWMSQYQQEPIERDGAVFNPEHMNFYNGTLPDEEPLKIVACCDVALGGLDYLSMPIAYVYENGDVYIDDVVYDCSEKSITMPRVVEKIISHHVTTAFFEANNGGEAYKDEVDMKLKERGFNIPLTSKFAQQMILPTGKSASKSKIRKEQRIWDSAQIIREFYYRDTGYQSPEYRKFMNNVYSFTVNGSNKHDDAPDSLASLAVFLNKFSGTKQSRIIGSPV